MIVAIGDHCLNGCVVDDCWGDGCCGIGYPGWRRLSDDYRNVS